MGQFPVADDAVDLEMLERAWVDALNRRDASVVSRIIAEDFAGIDSAGSGFTKASYLLDVCNGAFPAEPIVQDEVKIRLFGDSAVVTSRIKLQTGPRWNGSTNVYVKRQGRWCCVASQMLWIGAAKTLQPSLLTKGQEETHLANEEQLLKQLLVLQEKLAIAEMQNAHLRENSKKERASVQSNHPEGARSPNAAEPTTEQRQAIEELLLTRQRSPIAAVPANAQPASVAGHSDVHVVNQPYAIQGQRPEQVKIRPRLECLVEKIYVKAGETVKKGAALIDVSSIDLAAAKNDYLTKEVQLKHHQRILGLRRRLFEQNAVSEQIWTDAQNNEEKSKLDLQVARDKLKLLGLDDEAIERVGKEDGAQKARLTLRAPVDGTVSEVDADLGNTYDTRSVLVILSVTSTGRSPRF